MNRCTPMKQADVHQLVLDVVREVARGRHLASGTEFSRIGIGPWQRQRFFGPLRDAFNRHGLDIEGGGVTRGSFTRFETLRQVQAAIWQNVKTRVPAAVPVRQAVSRGTRSVTGSPPSTVADVNSYDLVPPRLNPPARMGARPR